MKAIIQRVTRASVTVGGEQISSIGRGLCVLLGISVEDTHTDAEYIVRKILNLRLFEDENGRAWSKSVMEQNFEVLCVSQFTLQCMLKGNKPDFHSAMPAALAQPFYASILDNMRSGYKPELIKDGKFGAFMQVHIDNDGPVTIEITSPPASIDPRQVLSTIYAFIFLGTPAKKIPASITSLSVVRVATLILDHLVVIYTLYFMQHLHRHCQLGTIVLYHIANKSKASIYMNIIKCCLIIITILLLNSMLYCLLQLKQIIIKYHILLLLFTLN
uniref:D-aminoacyl-tRNA deacylase 1 isoform X1 n=1 Tax=Doryrhamphus excisus TaxID=161450 RepID=UPI0025AE4B2D|nr:D-aminoacyl-tRNA deacylase 1 isoform X1 [Doryrhamphus excisus]